MPHVEHPDERIVAPEREQRGCARVERQVAASALDAEVHDDVAGFSRRLAQVESSYPAVLMCREEDVQCARDESNLHAHDVAEFVRVVRAAREEGPAHGAVVVFVVESEAAGPEGLSFGNPRFAPLESSNEVDDANVAVARGGDALAAVRARHELGAEYVVVVSGVHGSQAREPGPYAPHAHAQVVAAGEQEGCVFAPRHGVDAAGVPFQLFHEAQVLDEVRVAHPRS